MRPLYSTSASATGGRTGTAQSDDGALSVSFDTPPGLGGGGGPGTNPEQLFGAAYAASFLAAIKAVAGMSKVALSEDSRVTATVGIGAADEGTGYGLKVALEAHLPGLDKVTAQHLVFDADQLCAYSNATRSNVGVELSIA